MSKLMSKMPKQSDDYALSNARYLKYINLSKTELLRQNNFTRYTTERIEELREAIEAAIRFDEDGKVIGIPGSELAIMLFNNEPKRELYEGMVLAYFGLVVTSPNNHNIFYTPVECLDNSAYVVLPSIWHSFGATTESTNANVYETLASVEEEVSQLSESSVSSIYSSNGAFNNKSESSNSPIISAIKSSIQRITSELQNLIGILSKS